MTLPLRVAFLFAIGLAASSLARAGVIPAERTVDWSVAGYPGAVPSPVGWADATAFGAVGDGVTPAQSAITAAAASFAGAPGVVWLPAGDYLLTGGVSLPSGGVLRGDSAATTTLHCAPPNSGTSCVAVNGGSAGAAVAAIDGLERGSTAIVVADAGGFTAGGWAELTQDNGAWDTDPADWAKRVVGQIVRVVAVDGASVSIEHPLRIGYDVSLNPTLMPISPKSNVGIETLRIVRKSDPNGTGGGNNIQFSYAVRSWVHGVASEKSIGSHVGVFRSSQVEVKGSVFQDAWTFDGSATRGYGVTLNDHSGECLIEGNVFRRLRHAMMVKTGANGNVFAYNYSREPNRSEAFSDFAGDISVHGHYPFANLFEGNVVASVIIDQYWGRGGPYNTFFRNQLEWYGFIITPDNPTNDQNIVSNAIEKGKSNPLLGFVYTLYYGVLGTGHFTWGNDVAGTIQPPGTGTLADLSYYRPDGQIPCALAAQNPAIGPPVSVAAGTNQAQARWGATDMTLMPLIADVGPGATLEVGQSAGLTGTAWGGRAPLSLAWTPTAGLTEPTSATTDASPVTTTDYVFKATDAAGCSASATVTVTVTGDTATPTFEPPPGEVDEGTPVEIACATPDATIRYTTDGSEVLETSPLYVSPITLGADTTIRARAFKIDFTPSPEVSGAYVVIAAPPVPDEPPEEDDLGTVAEPVEDVAEPEAEIAQPGEDIIEPEADVTEPEADVTEPEADVTEAEQDTVAPEADIAGSDADASPSEPDVDDSPGEVVAPTGDAAASQDTTSGSHEDASGEADSAGAADRDTDASTSAGADVLPTPILTGTDGGCSTRGPGDARLGFASCLLLAALFGLSVRRRIQWVGQSSDWRPPAIF